MRVRIFARRVPLVAAWGILQKMIGRRLKHTGAKWYVRRVNNMVTLCAVLYGSQWKAYWNAPN